MEDLLQKTAHIYSEWFTFQCWHHIPMLTYQEGYEVKHGTIEKAWTYSSCNHHGGSSLTVVSCHSQAVTRAFNDWLHALWSWLDARECDRLVALISMVTQYLICCLQGQQRMTEAHFGEGMLRIKGTGVILLYFNMKSHHIKSKYECMCITY